MRPAVKHRREDTAGARALSQEIDLPAGVGRELVPLLSEDGAPLDSVLVTPPGGTRRTAVVLMHPTVSFLQHYLLAPFAQRGIAAMGVNSRYAGNDSNLFMEKVVLDLASAIRHLRTSGYERVVLIGNSGGGSLACFYQAEAEGSTVRSTPTGEAPDLTAAELPAADGLILLNAHRGRAEVLTAWMDAAVIDEADQEKSDLDLDIFNPDNGPPFTAEFVTRYRRGQQARNRRISAWARERLHALQGRGLKDEAFVVHRTMADPRFIDMTLEPSDRRPGMYFGPNVKGANYAASGLARNSSLRSWLSQWSLDDTNASAEPNLARIATPVQFVLGTADQGIFKSDAEALFAAAASADRTLEWVPKGTHYFIGQPDLRDLAVDLMEAWMRDRGLA
jgi:pimeloyl-ACP methyl ester carboxylesterase